MARAPSLGTLIDNAWNVRERKRELEAQMKLLEEEASEIEAHIMEALKKEGVSKATGNKASVSVSTSVVPQVENWDTFYAYIHKNKFYHLLERRPSTASCRELFEQKGMIPGAVAFTKVKVNLRSL